MLSECQIAMEVILSGKQEKWEIKWSVDLLTWNGSFRAA